MFMLEPPSRLARSAMDRGNAGDGPSANIRPRGAGKQEEEVQCEPRFSGLEGIAAVTFKERATSADG